jgi:hypothetical protein
MKKPKSSLEDGDMEQSQDNKATTQIDDFDKEAK